MTPLTSQQYRADPDEVKMNDDGDRLSDSATVHLILKNKTPADEACSSMEGHVFPEHEQLLQFLRRLKEVFDVCDEDADGFIRVEHLVDLGLQFGQGDEVRGCSIRRLVYMLYM